MPDWRVMEARCVDLYRVLLDEDVDPRALSAMPALRNGSWLSWCECLARGEAHHLEEPTTATTLPLVWLLFG